MYSENKICELFGVQYPIIQGGMVWVSGWRLASAVSNAGGVGLLGAGSMYPDVLREHIIKCKKATDKPFGVNLPLLYPNIEEHVQSIIELKVPIVFTSAGSPSKWTDILKKEGIKVVHVVSSVKFALKAQSAGVDAVVAEGFEAGGHNGSEETTTFCLIPEVKKNIEIPLLAAGGVATGRQMLAAMVLGADGVQIGTRFVATEEASAHANFKKAVLNANEGDTLLTLKEIGSVRLIKNKFFNEVQTAYSNHINKDDLTALVGKGRAKKGMFEGNMDDGMLEIGQCAASINEIKSAKEVITDLIEEYEEAKKSFLNEKG